MRFTENLIHSPDLERSISSVGFDKLNIQKEE